MKKTVIIIFFILCSVGLCYSQTPGESVKQLTPDEQVDVFRKAIAETTDAEKKASFHRELGEFYASRDDYKKAADEYMKALSLHPEFPENQRYKMALHISWAGRLPEAVSLLRKILEDNPKNIEARIHLARTLQWSGKAKEAYDEIETVLRADPEMRDALQVKASILNSMGKSGESISLSRKLLEAKEDFDTRLGLSYALMSSRKIEDAKGNAEILKPVYPYQDRELGKFHEELSKLLRPRYGVEYSYYWDSDRNVLNRYRLSVGKLIGDYDINVNYLFTSAKDDNARDNESHNLLIEASSGLTESSTLGLGLGVNRDDANRDKTSLIGYARIDQKMSEGKIGFIVNKYALTDTAELIENGITGLRLGVYVAKPLGGKLSLYAAYNYTYYSDNNNSNDFQLAPAYTILAGNPGITVRYTLRYQGFRRQSRSGYFDPSYILLNQLSAYLSYERGKVYMSLNPYGGYQSTERYGIYEDDIVGGGGASLGYRITRTLSLELIAEGGNSALSTTGGWNYYLAGIRLKGYF
jgi:thioredoxin-like negative regulator of GroEL